MATELATAYVTLVPSFKNLSGSLKDALGNAGIDGLGENIGTKLTSPIQKAFTSIGTVATGIIGSIGGAIGSLAASGGMARALNLEQAQTMFKGLKLDWNDYYDSIDQAVTGTAFSLDAAALVAANLAASGVSAGDQMSTALNACVGTAATFGTGLDEIGTIFQKVSAKGKLSGDELLQLSERGINATAVLGEYLGKTQAEVRDMVKNGQIDFQTFSNAMYAAFGDSAKAANETFTGAMANMQTALSRIGEKFATPFKNACIPVFNALREAINAVGSTLAPVVEKFSDFAAKVSGDLVSKIKTFTDALQNGSSIFGAFVAALGPVGAVVATVITAIGGLGAAFGVLSTALNVVPGLQGLVGALSGGAGVVGAVELAKSAITGFSGTIKQVPTALNSVGTAVTNTATKIPIVSTAMANLGSVAGGLSKTMGSGLWNCFETLTTKITTVGSKLPIVGSAFTSLGTKVNTMGSAFTLAGGNLSALGSVFGSALAGPMTVVAGLIAALIASFALLYTTNEEFRNSMNQLGAELMAALQPALESIMQSLQQMATAIMPAISAVITALAPVLTQIITLIAQGLAAVLPVIANLLAGLVQVIASIVTAVASAIQGVAEWLSQFQSFEEFINGFCQAVGEIWNAFWTGFAEICSQAWNGIVNGVMALGQSLQSHFSQFCSAIASVWGAFWQGLCDVCSTIWNAICSAVQAAIGVLTSVIQAQMNAIKSIWDAIWNSICTVAQTIWGQIQNIIQAAISIVSSLISAALSAIQGDWDSAWNSVCDALQTAWDTITEAVSAGIDIVVEFFVNLPGQILDALASLASDLFNIGSNAIQGLLNGINSMVGAVLNTLQNLASQAISIVSSILHIGSPSKVFADIGEFVMQGMDNGLQEGFRGVRKTLKNESDYIAGFDAVASIGIETQWSNPSDIDNLTRAISAPGKYQFEQATLTRADIFDAISAAMSDQSNVPIELYMDGKLVASTIASPMDAQLSLLAARGSRR